WQAGHLSAHEFGGPPTHPANDVELEHAVGRFDTAIKESQRVTTYDHRDGQLFSTLPVLFTVHPAVMTARHRQTQGLLVVHHRAIGAGVIPVLVRIACDAIGARPDIATAILFVPDRGGEFCDVNSVAHHDVLEHGAVFDDLVRNDLGFLQIVFAVGIAEFP